MRTLLVDTNVLWDASLRYDLRQRIQVNDWIVYFPTLVHAERIRQLARDKGEQFALDFVRQQVKDSRFQPLSFSLGDAETVAHIWLALSQKLNFPHGDNEDASNYWNKHKLDILLCAVAVNRGYTLVTDDKGSHFDLVPMKLTVNELKQQLNPV